VSIICVRVLSVWIYHQYSYIEVYPCRCQKANQVATLVPICRTFGIYINNYTKCHNLPRAINQ